MFSLLIRREEIQMHIKKLCVSKEDSLNNIRIIATGDDIPKQIIVLMMDAARDDFPGIDLSKVEVNTGSGFIEVSFFYSGIIPIKYERVRTEKLKYSP